MNKLKVSLSVLLVVFILAGIQLFMPSEVSADGNKINFPNLKRSDDDVLTWDSISNNVDGYIYASIRNLESGNPITTSGYGKGLTRINLYSEFKSDVQLPTGTYKFVLYATALNGDEYYYECNYTYKYHRLNKVDNISFDGEKVTWDFNDPEVGPDVEILYEVQVDAYLPDGSTYYVFSKDYENLTSRELPAYLFLLDGEYVYHIAVCTYTRAKGYQRSNYKSIDVNNYSPKDINAINGLKEENGLISWDPYPGAARYDFHFWYKHSSNGRSYTPTGTSNTYYFMPYRLRSNNFEQDIYIFVAALDKDGNQISSYSAIKYHYKGDEEVKYPLYIAGHQLSSHDDLADLFGWSADGKATYIPSENKLVFKDFKSPVNGSSTLTDPLFYSPESIIAEGTATLTANTELFSSDKDIIFSEGCNISGRSDTTAVACANISINGGQIDFASSDGDTMSSSGTIVVGNKTASVSLETSGDSSVAMKANDLRLGYSNIVEPVDGSFDAGQKTICDKDGTPARKVKLVHFDPTPTPTSTPTATATPTPTAAAKPTAGPGANPTAKPTVKPSDVSLTLDKNKASVICGKTLTLKATLKGASSKITWKSSDTKIATLDSNGKVKAKMAGEVTITATAAGKSAKCVVTVLYKDVTNSKDFWFAPTNYLTAKGVVKGYDNQTKFKPANKCTRAQMVTFIWRLQGEPAPKAKTCKFKDVKKTDYFYKACIWGNENHIVEGYKDGTFGPQIVCARKHAVTFLWRLANKPKPASSKNKFKDVKKSDYFYTATLWASEKKILAGYDDGTFRPNGDCLRRQMVTFLYKYDKFVKGKG